MEGRHGWRVKEVRELLVELAIEKSGKVCDDMSKSGLEFSGRRGSEL